LQEVVPILPMQKWLLWQTEQLFRLALLTWKKLNRPEKYKLYLRIERRNNDIFKGDVHDYNNNIRQTKVSSVVYFPC
jgi:hypothetical protein